MSSINLKSITGITSITTPAGVDNVFTVHTNDTVERFRIDQSGNQRIAGILTVTQDLDVDGHTNLDNVSIAGVTTGTTINATTFVGNLTGNATSADTVDVSGAGNANTNFYVTLADQNGAARTIKIDDGLRFNTSTNVLTAGSFVGDGSNLTGITGVTINNNTNNNLVTATGTTGTLNGEANLTFDGSVLTNTGSTLVGNDIKSSNDDFYVYSYKGGSDGQVRSGIQFDSNSQRLRFFTATNERLRITSGGGLQFRNADTPTNNSEPAMILNHAGGWQFYASSDTSTHNNIIFGTNSVSAGERLRITSGGNVRVSSGVIENAKTISSNYTVSTNFNAMSAGPMTVASGVSVTVPSGSAWTIV